MHQPRWSETSTLYFLESKESLPSRALLYQVQMRAVVDLTFLPHLEPKTILDFQPTTGGPRFPASDFCVLAGGSVVLADDKRLLVVVNQTTSYQVTCKDLPATISSVCCDPSSTGAVYLCGSSDRADDAKTEVFEVNCVSSDCCPSFACRRLFL